MTSLFPDHIETDRLVLDRLSTETVDPLVYYNICANDPGIEAGTTYVTWEPHATPKETIDYLRSREDAWESGRSADYVLRAKDGAEPRADLTGGQTGGTAGEPDDRIAGACGLTLDREYRTGELGIWLRKPFWGRGYAGERADALLALAFDRLELDLVSARVRADNERSLRAVEKYVSRHGGSRDGRFRNRWTEGVDDPMDVVRYSIERSAYQEAAGAQTTVEIM